jgi:hypothetical protein
VRYAVHVARKVQDGERGYGAHGVSAEKRKLNNCCASVMT